MGGERGQRQAPRPVGSADNWVGRSRADSYRLEGHIFDWYTQTGAVDSGRQDRSCHLEDWTIVTCNRGRDRFLENEND